MLIDSDFLGRGWSFPLGLSPVGQLQWSAGPDKIRQSILLILRTAPGERVLMPTFGCPIAELAFAQNDGATRALAQSYISEALQRWEPRINVSTLAIDFDSDTPSVLQINIGYIVRETNMADNLVYPFYLK